MLKALFKGFYLKENVITSLYFTIASSYKLLKNFHKTLNFRI